MSHLPPALRWSVYRLRKDGVKLCRADALASVQSGRLTIRPMGECDARLEDEYGNLIELLESVRVRILLPSGGMLLHGREVVQNRRAVLAYPQAWWCVLQRP